jgi:hypothetical protein
MAGFLSDDDDDRLDDISSKDDQRDSVKNNFAFTPGFALVHNDDFSFDDED